MLTKITYICTQIDSYPTKGHNIRNLLDLAIMNKIRLISAIFVAVVGCGSAFAQSTYQEKDASGEKQYYKIMSAYSDYNKKCIEDNVRNASVNYYTYLVNDSASDNEYQRWQLIPVKNGEENYYIKNGRGRFMKTSGQWAGSFYTLTNAITKTQAGSFEIYSVGSDQVVIRYKDSDGTQRYLSAVDTAGTTLDKLVLSRARNTKYAWKIIDLNAATGINSVTAEPENIAVTVIDRQIIVNGTDNYTVYDLQGRKVGKNNILPAGTYIVTAGGKGYKVLVR